jgi:DNA-binding NarL/FixJ family response regulator
VLQITPWERQTLQLLARGLPIGDIGSSLGIPASEVGLHVTALFTKMGVTNKDDAIADARKRGLVMNA